MITWGSEGMVQFEIERRLRAARESRPAAGRRATAPESGGRRPERPHLATAGWGRAAGTVVMAALAATLGTSVVVSTWEFSSVGYGVRLAATITGTIAAP